MNIKTLLSNAVDEGRRDIWDTDNLQNLTQPTNRHGAAAARQQARAEIWGTVMDYREERIDFNELLMSLQAFDRSVTPLDVAKLLAGAYDV
jgi:hypothetical protein